MEYKQVQALAKETMKRIRTEVRAGMPLREVRERCENHMRELGADSFWYYGVGAFVFSGNQTALSISGRNYQTPERVLEENDILTIDLSPQREGVWGDYARTIILQNGTAVKDIAQIRNVQWKNGLLAEERLHKELFLVARPELTFDQLYEHMNAFIRACGWINLDFNGNLGHSIVAQKDDRIYIEKGNRRRLGDVSLFTFEPHIGAEDSPYGYKQEDIYGFENGILKQL